MSKYLLDKEGKVFKVKIRPSLSGLPERYTDITKIAVVDEDAKDVEDKHIEAEFVSEIIAVEAVVAAEETDYIDEVIAVEAVAFQAAVEYAAAIEEIPAKAEYWTNGEDIVTDANDIPTLVDEDGIPSLDPYYTHVAAVEFAEGMAAWVNKKIKSEMEYPGHIKVTIMRETRSIQYV